MIAFSPPIKPLKNGVPQYCKRAYAWVVSFLVWKRRDVKVKWLDSSVSQSQGELPKDRLLNFKFEW